MDNATPGSSPESVVFLLRFVDEIPITLIFHVSLQKNMSNTSLEPTSRSEALLGPRPFTRRPSESVRGRRRGPRPQRRRGRLRQRRGRRAERRAAPREAASTVFFFVFQAKQRAVLLEGGKGAAKGSGKKGSGKNSMPAAWWEPHQVTNWSCSAQHGTKADPWPNSFRP